MSEPESWNYFNYYTEVEEHFRKARGSGLFLLSPLDWALIESWKNSGIPLEAALRGIDAAFDEWRRKPRRRQQVNSVAYCTQAVMHEAHIIVNASPPRSRTAEAPFSLEELRAHLGRNAACLRERIEFGEIADSLESLAAEAESYMPRLEELEQRLTALEDKLSAIVKSKTPAETLFEIRRDLDSSLRPYRGKMTADQIAMLERQYLEKRILEQAKLPRLSLFYLR